MSSETTYYLWQALCFQSRWSLRSVPALQKPQNMMEAPPENEQSSFHVLQTWGVQEAANFPSQPPKNSAGIKHQRFHLPWIEPRSIVHFTFFCFGISKDFFSNMLIILKTIVPLENNANFCLIRLFATGFSKQFSCPLRSLYERAAMEWGSRPREENGCFFC